MCGIHGFNSNSRKLIKRMVRASEYRGPDGTGMYTDNAISLGHNLLAITESADSSIQPLGLDGRWILCFNGEIYNYSQLRSELAKLGETFTTSSDTEVLAKGLRRHGKDFVYRLEGMYAIAWYDKQDRTLMLCRDSAGAKPLYVYENNDTLVFSSTIKSISAYGIDLRLDKTLKRDRVVRGSLSGIATLYENINKLYPGQILQYKLDKLKLVANEHVHEKIKLNDTDVDFNELRDKVSESVKMCLMGRRPIGLYLSGGLDSSIVLHELVQYKNKPKTFTTRWKVDKETDCNSDADVAKELSSHYKTDHTELLVTEQMYIDSFEDTVWALEQPFGNKSTPAYYAMNKTVSENGIVVTLSGDGGDELFTGYKRHLGIHRKTDEEKRLLLKEFHNKWSDYRDSWFPVDCLSEDYLNTVMFKEFLCRVSEDFLIRNDNLGMNFSMEARFPFTLKGMRDYAYSIPSKYKIKNNKTKVLLRDAYYKILPSCVTNKHKTGWAIPKSFIFNDKFRSFACDNIDSDKRDDIVKAFDSSYSDLRFVFPYISWNIWKRLFNISL